VSDALNAILAYKRAEVDALLAAPGGRARVVQAARNSEAPPPRGFLKALHAAHAGDRNALICEMKRRSPSAGDILPGADPLAVAQDYARGGAACLSVLTDGPSFGGSLPDLARVRAECGLPVLRKDFMIDPAQVDEARAVGCDAILIIMAAVSDALARELADAAGAHGLDVLVEVHDGEEMERALALPCPLIGINNRNLRTMTTDLATTLALSARVGPERTLVSESGVRTPEDIVRLRTCGVRTFLIGESLMKAEDRTAATRALVVAGRD
jgi:indole-3-glycerol phosphate synthase